MNAPAPPLNDDVPEGIDLSSALERRGVCQIPDAVDYILQACEAVAEAHARGVVRRGLGPANMFLTHRPDGAPVIQVVDPGIAGVTEGGSGAPDGEAATTPSDFYRSPEELAQAGDVDHRAGVYALGITLYELLAGRPPFQADTFAELRADILAGAPTPLPSVRAEVPDGLAAAVGKAYAHDREQRHQSIAELAASLAPYAPPRSQPSLDHVARLAGLSPPIAGVGGTPSPGHVTGDAAQARQPLQQMAFEIPIGGYHGPMSHRAARAFATGATTPTSPASPGGGAPSSSNIGLFLAVAIAVGLLLGGIAYFFFRR